MKSEIPFIKPSFPSPTDFAKDVEQIVKANWYTNSGPIERMFSSELRDYLGQDLQVATFANGTLALLAAIHSAVGSGDRSKFLMMPSFTFVAVPQAAIWNGYLPYFVDIDPSTWQMDSGTAREIIRSARDQIAGVILPNAFGVGNPAIAEWNEISDEFELPVVIDSAAGLGSRYADGLLLGGRGHCEIFSFHSTKPFGIGEGGALVSANAEVVDQAYEFQNFGFDKSRMSRTLGLNGKLSEIHAAIGRRQLTGLASRIEHRKVTFQRYAAAFRTYDLGFQTNAVNSSHFCANIAVPSAEHKTRVLQMLATERVQARDYYNPPLHIHPYFRKHYPSMNRSDLGVTESLCSRIISLPVHDHMDTVDIERIISAVLDGLS